MFLQENIEEAILPCIIPWDASLTFSFLSSFSVFIVDCILVALGTGASKQFHGGTQWLVARQLYL